MYDEKSFNNKERSSSKPDISSSQAQRFREAADVKYSSNSDSSRKRQLNSAPESHYQPAKKYRVEENISNTSQYFSYANTRKYDDTKKKSNVLQSLKNQENLISDLCSKKKAIHIRAFNKLLSLTVKVKGAKAALKLWERAQENNNPWEITPDIVTLNTAMHAHIDAGKPDEALRLWQKV